MPPFTLTKLVQSLADSRLLDPDHFELLTSEFLPVCQEIRIIVAEMLYRRWVTRYQIQEIAQGRASSLILGSYTLLEPLGEGGMGHVFKARNWKLNKLVALKVIRRDQNHHPSIIGRFLREIRALGAVTHPNIVHAFDADSERGNIFYAMEYFPGIDLGKYLIRYRPPSIQQACNFMMQAAWALLHAHERGLVHRDVKPANLLLTNNLQQIKLLDLGLARFASPGDDPTTADLSRVGGMIGTPDYVSPEQVRDSRLADIRSDLYSLGCTFYHLLTGRAPFHDASTIDKLYAQCHREPTPVEQIRPEIPHYLGQIVRKLMAKSADARYQDPGEFLEAMEPLLAPEADTINDSAHPTLLEHPAISFEDMPKTVQYTQDELAVLEKNVVRSR